MPDPIIYTCTDLLPIALSEGSETLVYEKELIYVGTFFADNGKHSVTKDDIDHWVAMFGEMKKNDIEIPVPLEHTDEPDKRRGTVVGMRAGIDEKGRYALFGKIKFNSEEDAKRGNQVSIFVPPSYKDGLGNEYYRPVRHVALTDYPVVPGLQGFEKVLTASLVRKAPPMDNLIQLLNDELGLQLEPGSNEAMVYKAVKSAIDAAKLAPPPTSDDPDEQEMEAAEDEELTDEEKKKKAAAAAPMSASLIKLVSNSRNTIVDGLVSEGKITTAVGKKLKAKYCSKDSLTLSFSQKSGDVEDDFDDVIDALKDNEPVISFGEKTKGQVLPKGGNVLIADAESRK